MRCLLAPILLVALAGTVAATEPRLEPIFNGRDLAGWASKDMEKFWRVEDGVLIGENDAKLSGNYLWSEKAYGDFVLEFDVRWTGEIDSGIEMRDPRIQMQLGVSRSLKRDMTGSFYVGKPGYPEAGQAKTAASLMHPEGRWNSFRVEARGPDFSVWINGQPASRYTDTKFTGAAPLGLQIHAGLKMKVEYRNLKLAALETPRCPFCAIIAGERQQEGMVYHDDQVTAFLSLGARNPGHILVVPNRHAENFMAVPADTVHHMTDVAQELIAAVKRTDLRAEGFMLQMNSGKAAGQSVFHAHLHIIPRFAGDAPTPPAEGATGQSEAAPPPKRAGDPFPMSELAPVAAKIKAALAAKPFELPAINTEVSLAQIKAICEHYGLPDLWRKIERDPPVRPFKSDGCTGWFDEWKGVSLYPAGFLHDLKYWAGYPGEDVARLAADAELMLDVARLLGSTEMAETMFHGVRVGGSEKLKTPFAWGFGRTPLDQPAAKTPGT